MNEFLRRVSKAMQTYSVERQTDGTFAIEDGYRCALVSTGLTAADEPSDICDEMNARAAIAAMREPTDAMIAAGFDDPNLGVVWTAAITPEDRIAIWRAMIDAASKDETP